MSFQNVRGPGFLTSSYSSRSSLMLLKISQAIRPARAEAPARKKRCCAPLAKSRRALALAVTTQVKVSKLAGIVTVVLEFGLGKVGWADLAVPVSLRLF